MTGRAPILDAVVLAAGAGTRFGGRKLTAPWGDGVLLDGALQAALAAPARAVTVVWGADAGVPKAAARLGSPRLRLVETPDHAEGLAASLRAGIAGIPPDADGAFVFLGDMPRVPVNVLAPMAARLARGAEAVAPVFEGRRGHPVLFSRALFPALLSLTGDQGAGDLLRTLGDRLATIQAPDDGVLFDVDRRSFP